MCVYYRTLTCETALARKAMAVVAEVQKVADDATNIVCVILLCIESRPSRPADCLYVFIKTKISSTPIPITTNTVTIVRREKVS